MKDNYFEEYKLAKLALIRLVNQIYDYDITEEEATSFGIKYTGRDIFNDLGYVSCVFHSYSPEGLYAWNKLGLDNPIVLSMTLWDMQMKINDEKKDDNIDYHRELLELKLIDIDLATKYYSFYMDAEEAKRNEIKYDSMVDLYNGKVSGYDHCFESAGETTWRLLGLEDNFIVRSRFRELQKDLTNELLNMDVKQKKLGGYHA